MAESKSINCEDILKKLKKREFAPVYFLMGEESYFIDKISDYIEENVLSAEEKDFNLTVIYGNETSIDAIVSTAKRYPMMAEYQVVIVKEAQNLTKTIDNLQKYVENPSKTTILVLAYKQKTLDKRKTFYKSLEKNGIVFTADKIKEKNVYDWLKNYVKESGYKINEKSIAMLVEYLGNDLTKISNEMTKLFVNVSKDVEISPELIQKHVGINKDYNIFELKDALINKDVLKANKIAIYFGKNPKENPIFKTIAFFYSFFVKTLMYKFYSQKLDYNQLMSVMGAYSDWQIQDNQTAAKNYDLNKLVRIISYLREYNAKAVGIDCSSNVEEGDLMRELVFKILH
jgi:DNA polymerase-3 subunit delta